MKRGFTIIELAAILAMAAVLAICVIAPALARTRPEVQSMQCLANLQRMQMAWQMYGTDYNDVMMPNGVAGTAANQTWNGGSIESWYNANGNTNAAAYASSLMGRYTAGQIGVFKCPADKIPSSNGQRLRTYSMNGQMGNLYGLNTYNPGYKSYSKTTDLGGVLPPSMALIWCEENICNLNDGYLQVNNNLPDWPDVPGSYHNGAMGASFGDGHVELHAWLTPVLRIPVVFGFTASNIGTTGTNPDYAWWHQHTAAPLSP